MPLSAASSREPLHIRTVTCKGYLRDDGMWDIEGHLTDAKTYGFDNAHRGHVEPGNPVHDMWIRLTVDNDFQVRDAEAATDASPYSICPDITVNFERLKGLTIGPGWRKQIHARLGGAHGCTHLVELLGPIATTAYQTIHSAKARARREAQKADDDPRNEPRRDGERPRLLNTCHAFGESSPVVQKYWPEFYKAPEA